MSGNGNLVRSGYCSPKQASQQRLGTFGMLCTNVENSWKREALTATWSAPWKPWKPCRKNARLQREQRHATDPSR